MNNKDKVIAQVYETRDYDKFKKLDLNRAVTEARRDKLIASFSVKSILAPIVVNKRFEIIDGQGRFEARRVLGLPIQYVIDASADIDDCRRMNRYNTPWKDVDYVNSYADGGNSNYIRLRSIMKELGIGVGRALRLANKATHPASKAMTDSYITSGTLEYSTEDMNRCRETVEYANRLRNALLYTGRPSEAFYNGISVLLRTAGFEPDKMLIAAEKQRASFSMMSTMTDMLKEFSRIYNWKRKVSNRLYFEDYMRNKGNNVRTYDETGFAKSNPDVSTLKRRAK